MILVVEFHQLRSHLLDQNMSIKYIVSSIFLSAILLLSNLCLFTNVKTLLACLKYFIYYSVDTDEVNNLTNRDIQ